MKFISNADKLRIFIPFAFGYFVSYLFRVINAVLAPDLANDLSVDPSELGLLTSVYLITFALFQIPLGVLLDRYGPRTIEASLLVVAAVGAWIFAHATSLLGLVVGRGLIGFGVSACLMAAFKAFVIWFPKQQLPQLNGFQMASGGLGALFATVPVQAALSVTDWRGIFILLSLVCLLAAGGIFFVVPMHKPPAQEYSLTAQFKGVGTILTSFKFWRIAPWATVSQATFLAIQGLWAGPWLRDVAGLTRGQIAGLLLMVAVSMIVGYIGLGTLARRLSRRGIAPMVIAGGGMMLFMVQFLMIIVNVKFLVIPAYLLFGFFGTAGILVYAVLSQQFTAELTGRVTTALNFLVFATSFAAQWGIGAVINCWPLSSTGGYAHVGYQIAFSILLGLQVVAAVWFWLTGLIHAD